MSNVVASQIDLHSAYGGVVPEIASRAHVEQIIVVIRQALAEATVSLDDIDALAVTATPGLIGALLVGVETVKGIVIASGKPFVPVHHVRGHLYSPMLEWADGRTARVDLTDAADDWDFPYLGLAVSGGHTSLARVDSPSEMKQLGETRDDAAGEAYDKVAKLLGLGYPGGPIVDGLAGEGDVKRFELPRPMLSAANLDFSFSGLKTAVRQLVEREEPDNDAEREVFIRDLCAAFQQASIDVLLGKAARAAKSEGLSRLAIVGGVACNRGLRAATGRLASDGIVAVAPEPALCGDNAAMIAGLGYHQYAAGERGELDLNPRASKRI